MMLRRVFIVRVDNKYQKYLVLILVSDLSLDKMHLINRVDVM